MNNGNYRSSELGTPPANGTSIGNTRSGLCAEDPVIGHARVLNNDGARAQFKQDALSRIKTEPTKRMEEPSPPNSCTFSFLTRAEGRTEPSQCNSDKNSNERFSFQDPAYIRSKRGHTVESHFKEKKFTGSLTQSIDNLISVFHVYSVQQALNLSQMSLFIVDSLADPARQYFLTHCSSNMPFQEIVNIMRWRYSSETRKLQIQFEMDSLDITVHIHDNDIKKARIGTTRIIDRINSLAPQLPAGFGDDAHKIRYLRRAVMGQYWAQTPISHIARSRYSFVQFITALEESLQIIEESSRAREQSTLFGQDKAGPRSGPQSDPRNRRPYILTTHARASLTIAQGARFHTGTTTTE